MDDPCRRYAACPSDRASDQRANARSYLLSPLRGWPCNLLRLETEDVPDYFSTCTKLGTGKLEPIRQYANSCPVAQLSLPLQHDEKLP